MATNPRIDDLRRRLEKEPNSRLFAQLAEELRKDGDFEEAIRIARAGLARHPAYPSARMTLGRALFDTGDLAAARQELESVLEGAPDNILASRLLAECLEGLGDVEGALGRFRATLALSPGDKQIAARVRDLEGKMQSVARPRTPSPAASEAAPAAEPAPIPLATVDEPMVLEISHERSSPGPAPAPPVAEAAAEFELESAYEAPGAQWQGAATASAPAPSAPAPEAAPEPVSEPPVAPAMPEPPPMEATPPALVATTPDEVGERTLADVPSAVDEVVFDTPRESSRAPEPPAAWQPEPIPEPEPEIEPEPELAPAAAAMPPLPEPVAIAAPPAPRAPVPAHVDPAPQDELPAQLAFEPERGPAPAAPSVAAAPALAATPRDEAELVSPTLAELYFNQGFPEKAAEVYRRILEREPGNERARARIAELQAGPAPAARPTAADSDQARAERRAALERTIERLESLRAALQKGAR